MPINLIRGEEYFFRKKSLLRIFGKAPLVVSVRMESDGSMTAITNPFKKADKTVQERIRDWQCIFRRDIETSMVLEARSQKIFTIDRHDTKGIQVSLCRRVRLFKPKLQQ